MYIELYEREEEGNGNRHQTRHGGRVESRKEKQKRRRDIRDATRGGEKPRA